METLRTLPLEDGRRLLPSNSTGRRFASRVRILPGSRFDGCRGLVVRIHHAGAIDVRLTAAPVGDEARARLLGLEFPFGLSELEVLP